MADCTYPMSEWDPRHLAKAKETPRYLPKDWQDKVKLNAPPAEPECAEVLKLKEEERQGKRLTEIRNEAEQGQMGILRPIFAMLGPRDPSTSQRFLTRAMLSAAAADISIAVMCLKLQYQRGRPRHCCDEQQIEPMYRHTVYDPLHASYPSGHSSHAHAAALLLSDCVANDPALKTDMLAAAARVAQNREVAGLHYPSDSAAGADLAAQLVALLLSSTSFQAECSKPALTEWP